MMNHRLLAAGLLLWVLATSSVEAGPTFSISGGPTAGPGGSSGNAVYSGVNNFGGTLYPSTPNYGILGLYTPLNAGTVLSEALISFSVNGNSGTFDIINGNSTNDFTGTVLSSAVTSTGGGFLVEGVLSSSAAAHYGVSAGTELYGEVAIQFAAAPPGFFNEIASVQVVFAIPEPSSVVLVGIGAVGLAAFGLRRMRSKTGLGS